MTGQRHLKRWAMTLTVVALSAACSPTNSATPSPTPTGLAAALLTSADVPGSPHNNAANVGDLQCIAPTDGAVQQVEVSYPVGPQTGPEAGYVVNLVVHFSGSSAQAFMTAQRAQFASCTSMHIQEQFPTETQLSPPHLGDDAARYVYDQCDRFGCVGVDNIFIRKGSVVSVIVNFSSVLGTLDSSLTDKFAARAAAHLASLTAT